MMGLYEVLLGVDRAARDSGRRMTMTVCEKDPLSAAITAEAVADGELDTPLEYSHAMNVECLRQPDVAATRPSRMRMVA